ncbi:hypothetical protein F4678DRAFT_421626 [Xylaria arbuscula]|nr:hypothetical protein F4678DRAFT_421626 [Xylaria arbuscula]
MPSQITFPYFITTGIMAQTPQYHGSLIAFEGPQDIISTQLHLLPNSPKLLILPSFHYFAKESDASSHFDARSLILKAHEACHARAEVARTFLRESTPDNKRLVFVNGCTISARMSCISAISKHKTNGDIIKAEDVFNNLIQDGIAGLKRQIECEQEFRVVSKTEAATNVDGEEDNVAEDPSTRAMRAADALYLETSFLQDTDEFDLVSAIRPRSISVPALPVVDSLQDPTSFIISGPPESTDQTHPHGGKEKDQTPEGENRRVMTASGDRLMDANTSTRPPGFLSYNPLRPTSAVGPPHATVESVPSSPVLLGEARIVDIRSHMPSNHKRIKSVDRIYAAAIRNQDISLCNFPQSNLAKLEEGVQNTTDKKEESDEPNKPTLRSNFYSETSHPTFAKPNRAITRKGLPPPLTLDIESARRSVSYASPRIEERSCAHDGPLAEPMPKPDIKTEDSGSFLNLADDLEPDAEEPFQTVLPMIEDLVIHFKDNETAPELEAMIRAFQNGTSQISMSALLSYYKGTLNQPMTPTSRTSTGNIAEDDVFYSRQVTRGSTTIHTRNEDDTLESHENHPGRSASGAFPTHDTNLFRETIVISTPPTPAQTPPPRSDSLPNKLFHDFDIKEYKTAICIQNALRSILNVYFPPKNIGYHQFNFPLLPELSSFWRPVFRETPSRDSNATRKIDLILAIGSQKGASRGLLGTISGSLEKLGREADGTSRSGRLDLRYLIANAMQAFTSQPLANQTQANPFSDPLLLATLIIPHLETYIAAHSTTRFLLLEYPTEYLSTVLSLQHLMGVDLLKVAGIIDAETSETKSHRAYRKQSSHIIEGSPISPVGRVTSPTSLSPKAPRPELETHEKESTPLPSFSKANFVLSSAAEDSDITIFISTIWRILIGISDFYIPESVTVASWKTDRNDHPLSSSSFIHPKEQYAHLFRAAEIIGFAPPQLDQQQQRAHQQDARSNYVSSGTYADLPMSRQRPITPSQSSKASIVDAFRSRSATRPPRTPTSHSQGNKLKRLLGHEAAAFAAAGDVETVDAVPYYEFDGEEEDGGFWAEERKYMPLWSHQNSPRKANSRKALKWLGLAN